jgi:hypothetical protein
LASKPVVTFLSGLASKPVVTVSSGLTSKPVVGFLIEPQNQGSVGFSVWALKPAAKVWWFGHQNRRDDFLVWTLKPIGLRFIGRTIKSTEGGRRGTHIEI